MYVNGCVPRHVRFLYARILHFLAELSLSTLALFSGYAALYCTKPRASKVGSFVTCIVAE